MPMTDIERRRHAAYWYAVGRGDAEGHDIASEFAAFAGAQAIVYYDGHGTFLASITGQWDEFVAALNEIKGG